MKMIKFKQNKLCRDKIIDQLEKTGSIIHWKQLDDVEFGTQLKIKFMEEAKEVFNASTKATLIEELADILEVISALGNLYAFTLDDIITAQHKKHDERGGFNERKFVTIAEHAQGSFGEKYCLNDPEKYPEV